ncbi:MAG: peptidoglycan DD-metalloendopeptidase family protein [Bacteroidales bacterium]|nr:peptidoglycan DD-metalloendopeptidase family protein [Bacteroidales bacterium]
MKRMILIAVIAIVWQFSFAQGKTPVDTISRGNLTVILYNDKTWQYVDIQPSAVVSPKVDSSSITAQNWITNSVYAQKPDYARTKDTCIIDFGGDINNYNFPVYGKIYSRFGMRSGKMHTGVDIELSDGDTVVAAFDGVVRFAGWNNSGYGNVVVIRHYNGLETLYAHLSAVKCSVNQKIKAGECVGLGGSTGRANGTHLHFETRLKDNAFDPELVFNVQTGVLVAEKIPIYPGNFDYMKYVDNSEYHVVKSGDTLYAIARKYHVSVKQICDLNGIKETSILSVGKRLRLR